MTGFIGIVCGLQSEARAVQKAAGAVPVWVGVSGADADRAHKIALEMAQAGAWALMSAGISGGLSEDAPTGALLIASAIVTQSGETFETDARLNAAMTGIAPYCTMFGSDAVIETIEHKHALYAQTGALAVDMESHAAAKAAREKALPYCAVRTIADPVDRLLPPLAMAAIGPDGKPRIAKTVLGMVRHPGQIAGLMALGRDSSAALKALEGGLAKALPRLSGALDL